MSEQQYEIAAILATHTHSPSKTVSTISLMHGKLEQATTNSVTKVKQQRRQQQPQQRRTLCRLLTTFSTAAAAAAKREIVSMTDGMTD